MPARLQNASIVRPADLALFSISAGVSSVDTCKPYLHARIPVKSNLADGREPIACAGMRVVDRQLLRDYIASAMKALDTDLTGLARRSGVSPSTLTRVFKGDRFSMPLLSTIAKVAQASGVPLPPEIAAPPDYPAQFPGQLDELSKTLKELGQEIEKLHETFSARASEPTHNLPLEERREWLRNLALIPAAARNDLLKVVRGMAKAVATSNNETNPRDNPGVAHSNKSAA